MPGVSTGPRQFQLMSSYSTLKDGEELGTAKSGWEYGPLPAGSGGCCWTIKKLDLRAFNSSDRANGLDLLAISVQEASPVFSVTDAGEEPGAVFMMDVLTTHKVQDEGPNQGILEWIQSGLHQWLTPGFLYSPPSGASGMRIEELSPSQVIWGLWRAMGVDRNMTGVEQQPVLKTYASSNFGGGEVMVSPHCYWSRVVVASSPEDSIYIPSANLHMAVNALDLTDGQEMIQMIRSSGR